MTLILGAVLGSTAAAAPVGAHPRVVQRAVTVAPSRGTKTPKPKPPRILPHPNVRAEATSPRGAIVNYRRAIVRGATSVRYSKSSGTLFPLGTTTVTIVAKNRGGTSRAKFKVIVADTTPPTFAPITDVTATATSFTGATVTFPAITATDRVDPSPTITCSPASGSVFRIGTTTVSCSARDASGNSATGSFNVVVNPFPPRGVDGQYRGTTSQGKPISFNVVEGGYYITNISAGIQATCTPDATFEATWTLSSVRFGIPPDGNFVLERLSGPISGGAAGTATHTFRATFAGSGQVTGTIQSHYSLTSPGVYECDSGTVSWSAVLTS